MSLLRRQRGLCKIMIVSLHSLTRWYPMQILGNMTTDWRI